MSNGSRLPRFPTVGDPAVRSRILALVDQQGYASNSRVRADLGVGYDEAIAIFNWLLAEGALVRIGKAGGTRYLRPIELEPRG
jgi:hypothetical protein